MQSTWFVFRFSSGGTKSVLHTDAYENLHCLASGIKEFVLIEPKYINLIGSEHGVKGYYDLDVEKYVNVFLSEIHHRCYYNIGLI